MSLCAQVVAELVAAGLSGEALIAACQRIEAAVTVASQTVTPTVTVTPDVTPDASKEITKGAMRTRRYRENKAKSASASQTVTSVTPPVTCDAGGRGESSFLPSLRDSGKKELEIQHARVDRFPEFWAAYPKREGTNPRKPAAIKFDKIVSRGADPGEVISGAHRYAQHLKATGKEGSQFVQQTVTWLNQEGWKDEYHQGQNKPDDRDLMGAAERVRARFSNGHRADAQGSGFSDGLFDRADADLDLSANHLDH